MSKVKFISLVKRNIKDKKKELQINRDLKKKIDNAKAIVDTLLETNEHLQYLHDLKEALK